MGANKTLYRVNLKLSDADLSKARSAIKDGKKIKSLRVKIEASHSGIVNKNNWFYIPKGMKDGASTFVEPYNKPVTLNHDPDLPPVGRVVESTYVDYEELSSSIKDSLNPTDIVDAIADFVKGDDFNDESYKGLGHLELVAEITDEDAINKILDGRYITVSIGGNSSHAVCSICGTDMKDEENAAECDHYRGEYYDGEKCFYIGGFMDFDHVSYVNSPADKNAKSEVISDSDIETQDLSLLDFVIEDSNEGNQMKFKLEDLFGNSKIVAETLSKLGLSDHKLTDERYSKLRKTSFLFAKEKFLPVNDKAHVLVAKSIMDQVEESEDKAAAVAVLDRKFENLFGKDVSFEDALKSFVPEKVEDNVDVKKEEEASLSDSQVEAIADKVVEKFKSTMIVQDSYDGERAQLLEREVEALTQENEDLINLYKDSLVNQILEKEGKLGDKEYSDKLKSRSLDSIKDKLEDLLASATSIEDKPQDQSEGESVQEDDQNVSDSAENDGLEENSVDINDAADHNENLSDSDESNSEGEQGSEEDKADLEDADGNVLSIEDVRQTYKSKVSSEGFASASAYLQELRDNNTLPDNFTF